MDVQLGCTLITELGKRGQGLLAEQVLSVVSMVDGLMTYVGGEAAYTLKHSVENSELPMKADFYSL